MHRYRFQCTTEETMKQITKTIPLAASAFALAALFSFSWSEQSGIALSIESAQARVGRPLTPVSVAGVARRQYRRAAIGTAAVVGAGAAYYGGAGYNTGSPYHSDTVRGARAAYGSDYAASAPIVTRPHYAVGAYYAGGPWYGYSGWSDYAARNAISCTPGTTVKLEDGLMHVCQ
jgi:hypothetical protein